MQIKLYSRPTCITSELVCSNLINWCLFERTDVTSVMFWILVNNNAVLVKMWVKPRPFVCANEILFILRPQEISATSTVNDSHHCTDAKRHNIIYGTRSLFLWYPTPSTVLMETSLFVHLRSVLTLFNHFGLREVQIISTQFIVWSKRG